MCKKILKLLIITESILGVHRMYYRLPKFGKILIGLKFIIEILLSVCSILFSYVYSTLTYQKELSNFIINIGSSFLLISLALFYSKKFSKLVYFIEKNHVFFKSDKIYLKNLDKLYKVLFITIVFYFFLRCGMSFSVVRIKNYGTKIKWFEISLHYSYMLVCNLRYAYQYFVLYAILSLLSEHLNCITRRICKERKLNTQREEDELENVDDVVDDVTNLDEWMKVYSHIKECSNLINDIFGIEISVLLVTLTFYFIKYLYAFTFVSVKGLIAPGVLLVYNLKIAIFLLLLFLLSRSAQRVQNGCEELRRHLGKLLIQSISDEETFKATKAFLHLVSHRPIKTQGFGSIEINMTLVPKFIMFFTTYTVTALQFNNVV